MPLAKSSTPDRTRSGITRIGLLDWSAATLAETVAECLTRMFAIQLTDQRQTSSERGQLPPKRSASSTSGSATMSSWR